MCENLGSAHCSKIFAENIRVKVLLLIHGKSNFLLPPNLQCVLRVSSCLTHS